MSSLPPTEDFCCPYSKKINDPECPLTEDVMGVYSPDYKAFICPKCEVYSGYIIDENGEYVEAE